MSQDGYTLAETMAALLMIGLAIGGLGQATYLIGRLNRTTSADVAVDRHMASAQRTLDSLLVQAGPFHDRDSAGFSGRGASFVFPCDRGLCGAELVSGLEQTSLVIQRGGHSTASRSLGRLRDPHFVYRDAAGLHEVWPVGEGAESVRDGGALTLDAVALVEGRGDASRPLAVAALWAQQPAACQLDSISGDCREVRP